jgi:Ca-activated chloride channel homolog
MSKLIVLLMVLVCAFCAMGQNSRPQITQGSLYAYDKKGKELGDCPLRNTAVKTDISGFIARVHVTQNFENSFAFPIEAVYTFPLSQNGAVDDMTMNVGSRVIRAKIMKRAEARATYEQARSEGKTASLLDQERPNIFTQSVANIMPGDKVTIEITYVETLKYEDGAYEFVFPMTVGPRYIPALGVKDADKIRPPYAATRNGSDVSVEVNVNAGVPIQEVRSVSHEISQVNFTPATAKITLKDETTIPNKDFILRYDVSGGKIEDAVLAHRDERGGFFTLILQPPDKFTSEDRTPKEIVFVLDTSGSMYGFPIDKAKEAMKMSLDGLYPDDTFNLITFSGDTSILFDEPVAATEANVEKAKAFLDSRQGGGGTEMMKAIKAALDPSDAKDHVRIVCFMTDGFVGNDDEIVAEIKRHPQARVFSFGIGSSVNRSLLDRMADAGRGEAQYVTLNEDGSAAAKKFYERVRTPLLTDLWIDWNGLPVTDMYPSRLTDLFSAKPVIVHGRFTKAASGTIKLRGLVAGQPYEREIAISLPENEPANDALASLWARTRIDELTSDKLSDANAGKTSAIEKQITDLAINYRLMTNFTSFVAVEDRVVNQNGKSVTVQVPVEVPEGVDPTMSGANAADPNSQFGRLVVQNKISSLPTNGRQVTNGLVTIQPGVAGGGGGGVAETVTVTESKSRRSSSGKDKGRGVGYGSGNGTGQTSAGVRSSSGENGFRIDGIAGTPPPASMAFASPLKILSKPKPNFSDEAKTAHLQGSVMLKVTFLATGQVGEITPITQLPDGLTEQAVAAAREIKFEPRKVNGVPQSSIVTVIYEFSEKGTGVRVSDGVDLSSPGTSSAGTESPSPQLLRQERLREKLHMWLYALVERIDSKVTTPTTNEVMFVHDDKADIQLDLSAADTATIEKLKAAGLEVTGQKGTTLTGRIAVEKLAGLADITEVKLILPVIG